MKISRPAAPDRDAILRASTRLECRARASSKHRAAARGIGHLTRWRRPAGRTTIRVQLVLPVTTTPQSWQPRCLPTGSSTFGSRWRAATPDRKSSRTSSAGRAKLTHSRGGSSAYARAKRNRSASSVQINRFGPLRFDYEHVCGFHARCRILGAACSWDGRALQRRNPSAWYPASPLAGLCGRGDSARRTHHHKARQREITERLPVSSDG